MVKLVKNSIKANIPSRRLNNLKMNYMMIKPSVIHCMDKIKYYMNKKHIRNKSLVRIIWHHLYYHILKKL
jgi:hypothetical protein